ncbi:DUF6005 family protein [Leisingera sp. ANG-Vp]|uniref:DUF6005 family protein n=1 Tax=Leisingera sp. ANG-Vp TaxID=1577896 RepID=UPI00057E06DF|nr:DUF6005 family protein [Leisingera sp. ANG-Vp]KIC20024.1 hypothetical protein RA20_10940 [Leisingera sp. ANG-Vp]
MTYESILSAIRMTLEGPLANEHMALFRPEAVLNDELHLDSVILINLMLHLETDHGIEVPEREFSKDDFATVDGLIRMLLGQKPGQTASTDETPAPSEITVHCFVSCMCAAIRRHEQLNFRPFHFGTWDSSFAVTPEMRLSYHSEEMTQDLYARWVERLYNIQVREWYDHGKSKDENLAHFERLLSTKTDDEQLVVFLDMYHLPERENKYNQNPFPHFVIIELTDDPDVWHLYDPDYRWRGDLPRETILNAMAQPTVAGGYTVNSGKARAPHPEDLADYFHETFRAGDNVLTSALRRIFEYHCLPEQPLQGLKDAIREMPVLSLRKYAYEHAFAFFWQELDTAFEDFDAECDRVEALCEGFRKLHYLAARAAHTQDRSLIPDLFAALDALDELEFSIKSALKAQFDGWCAVNLPASASLPQDKSQPEEVPA